METGWKGSGVMWVVVSSYTSIMTISFIFFKKGKYYVVIMIKGDIYEEQMLNLESILSFGRL
jgi:hypothetical protein